MKNYKLMNNSIAVSRLENDWPVVFDNIKNIRSIVTVVLKDDVIFVSDSASTAPYMLIQLLSTDQILDSLLEVI